MTRQILLVVILLVSVSVAVAQDGDQPTRIIFMHHSTGQNLMNQGGLRGILAAHPYELWDHGYNGEGLSDASGHALGTNWNVPNDNTDPDGWYHIFDQPISSPPDNTFSHMLEYDVIIFKSCFPSSDIYSEERLEAYRSYYLSIRDVMDQHPDKIFIPWTTPPLVPNETSPENAARAQQWSAYLTSDEYMAGHENVFVFDIFSLWSDEAGFLRAEYRADEWDSHPNEFANRTAAPIFAEFIHNAIQSYTPTEAPAVVQVDTSPPEDAPSDIVPYAENRIDDFEGGDFADVWWSYADAGESGCALGQPAYSGDHALQVTINLAPQVYAGCGIGFEQAMDQSAAGGLHFFLRGDGAVSGIMSLWVEDPQNPDSPTPFDAPLPPPSGEWTAVMLDWDIFTKAEWMGDGGVDALDPARLVGLSLDFGHWENAQNGTLWIDDLYFYVAE